MSTRRNHHPPVRFVRVCILASFYVQCWNHTLGTSRIRTHALGGETTPTLRRQLPDFAVCIEKSEQAAEAKRRIGTRLKSGRCGFCRQRRSQSEVVRGNARATHRRAPPVASILLFGSVYWFPRVCVCVSVPSSSVSCWPARRSVSAQERTTRRTPSSPQTPGRRFAPDVKSGSPR